jgi:RNA polymerase primary sigma factor
MKTFNANITGVPLAVAISGPYTEAESISNDERSMSEDPAMEGKPLTTQATAAKQPVEPRWRESDSHDGDTPIRLYLREIARVKVLTAQAEIDLAARIKKGDKKAREQMLKANLPLVVKIAHGFEGNGLPLLDLISEGNLGLMKAIGRFDPARGNKLAKCGSRWIKLSMSQALATQSKALRSREPSSSS